MCQGVVKAHGGHIWAEAGRRRGARFFVDLPDPRHSTPAWHQSLLGVDLANAPIRSALIVEPDVMRMERLRQAVASAGFKVHVAADPPVALRKLRAADFDALLIGGSPERGDAIELCTRARVQYPELAGRLGVVCAEEPDPAERRRLELAGARLLIGDRDAEALAQFVRDLAEVEVDVDGVTR